MSYCGSMWEPSGDFWRHRSVAVTGATGLVGSHLTTLLRGLGASVVILERDQLPIDSLRGTWQHDVAVVRGDITDQPLIERLIGEYDVRTLFHLAAQTQVVTANVNPISTLDANIRGTWTVLEAARRSPRLEHVVVASSDKAYGEQPVLPYDEDMALRAIHPYDVSKACADMLTVSYHRTYGVAASITRCGNFFGPGDRNWDRLVPSTVRSVLFDEPPVIRSDGTLVRDYLYVGDGALAYVCLAEAMAQNEKVVGEAFNFSTETPLTVLELVDRIQRAAGTAFEPIIQGRASHEIARQVLDASKARAQLDWQPHFEIDEALAQTVAWYRAELLGP